MRHLRNIFNLGIKELRSLLGDKAMLTLIVFSFTVSVYSSATVTPGSLNLAPIAIADMDQSQLSNRIVNSFYRPWFLPPEMTTADDAACAIERAINRALEEGIRTGDLARGAAAVSTDEMGDIIARYVAEGV